MPQASAYLVALTAFTIVMLCMTFLTLLLYGLRALGRREGAPETVPAGAPATAEAEEEQQLLAVLAAAAREALQAPVHVHRVHVYRDASTDRWSRAGRMDIMVSHRVEPKR